MKGKDFIIFTRNSLQRQGSQAFTPIIRSFGIIGKDGHEKYQLTANDDVLPLPRQI